MGPAHPTVTELDTLPYVCGLANFLAISRAPLCPFSAIGNVPMNLADSELAELQRGLCVRLSDLPPNGPDGAPAVFEALAEAFRR